VQIDDVAGATLRLDSNETIGVLSGGGATGGVLNLQANTLTVGSGTFSGAINGTGGGLTKTGTGTLLLDGGVANGFTGVTTVSAGNLNLSRSTTNSTILGNVTIDGGTLNILSNEQIANTSIITQTSGAFRLNGRTETIGTYNKSGGTFSTGIGGKLFLLGNTWTENGGVSTIDAEGAINDANVNILNGGTIEVYGSNNASYSPGPFGTFGGELQVVTGGTGLNFGDGSNAVNLDSDATAADVGKLVLSSSITTTGTGSSLITSVGAGAVKGIVDLNAGTRTIDTGANNNLTVSAVITNGGITKSTGTGSLILTEANTYDLGTTVNTGTLLVNNTTGSGTGTGNVTIDAGATLGGSGIIAPTVNNASVSVQGLLNVGNAGTGEDLVIDMSGATGTLVIDLTGGVTLDYFSGQGTGVLNTGLSFNDQLGIVGGGATLNLGGDLTFNNFNGLAANTFTAGSSWKLFAWSGVTTSGAFSNITGTIGNFTGFTDLSGELLGWDFTNLYTTGIVSIVAIPEPSRAMLLLLGLLSLGFRRRRNRF
jgi:fibronectin-binding autotransporter adhesin